MFGVQFLLQVRVHFCSSDKSAIVRLTPQLRVRFANPTGEGLSVLELVLSMGASTSKFTSFLHVC